MSDTTSVSASRVKEAILKTYGHTVTFTQMTPVFADVLNGAKVTGNTDLPGTVEELVGTLADALGLVPEAAADATAPETTATSSAQPKKGKKSRPRKPSNGSVSITTSNRPPRIKRTQSGEEAAANLIQLVSKWDLPEVFPFDLTKFRRNGVPMIRGTTVDGEVIELTQMEALENLQRRDEMAYAIPLFSEAAQREIVTAVSKLDGAPAEDAVDENELRIYRNRNAWFFNLLQIGIRIWAKQNNPPSLNLDDFPDREYADEAKTIKIEPVVFRYRPVELGFVAKVLEAYQGELLASNLTGTALREFSSRWLEEFISKQRNVMIGGQEKSFADFRGSADKFRTIWSIVENNQRTLSAKKSAAPRRKTRRSE